MRLKKKRSGIHEGDLTPMIDMTFQLIAFFMVLVNFAESEQNQKVVLPDSELAKPPEKAPEDYLVVHVTKDKEAIIDGFPNAIDSMSATLIRKAQFFESIGKVVGDVVVIIRAHKDAQTGDVQKVIQECQEARFEKFVLRAKEKQG